MGAGGGDRKVEQREQAPSAFAATLDSWPAMSFRLAGLPTWESSRSTLLGSSSDISAAPARAHDGPLLSLQLCFCSPQTQAVSVSGSARRLQGV